jgi:Ca2+-binding RTX toxin-like protein
VGLKLFSSRRSKNRLHQAAQSVNFIEPLEGRQLLAGTTALLAGGALTVTGRTGANNNITITEASSNIVVKAGAQQIGSFATANSAVKSIVVNGSKGNDTITLSLTTTSITVTISGGLGNDTITGSGGAELIYGNGGNDKITASAGNDTIVGSDGNDFIDAGAGDDSISGGGGNDSLLGGDGNDTIDGSSGADSILGGAGADSLLGGNGVDTITGNSGADTIIGGLLNDIVNGGNGKDLTFTEGSDVVTNVEAKTLAWIPVELADAGLTVSVTADPLTGKQITVSFAFSKVQADSQVSVRWKNVKGNNYNFVVDVKKNVINTAANVARTVVINLGTQSPGAKKFVSTSATGLSTIVTNYTVAWIAPTG